MKTEDVCPLDFPPVSYGQSLAEVEHTIQRVLETIFRDESGLLLSGVNGRTMEPLRPGEVTERQFGLGGGWENMSIPKKCKNIGMNFENCHQSSGKYLDGLVDKYAVTGDPDVLGYARKIVGCTRELWEVVGETHRYGKGWIPKPFAGMNELSEMDDSSVDQYADLTFGLEKYYNELATPEERDSLEEMFLSFADWWIDHNYTTSYSGFTVWWDRVHTLSQAYFLYLFELAYSISPRRRFRDAFDYVLSRAEEELTSKEGPLTGCNYSPNTAGIVVEGMARMALVNPQPREIRQEGHPELRRTDGSGCHRGQLLHEGLPDLQPGLVRSEVPDALLRRAPGRVVRRHDDRPPHEAQRSPSLLPHQAGYPAGLRTAPEAHVRQG